MCVVVWNIYIHIYNDKSTKIYCNNFNLLIWGVRVEFSVVVGYAGFVVYAWRVLLSGVCHVFSYSHHAVLVSFSFVPPCYVVSYNKTNKQNKMR